MKGRIEPGVKLILVRFGQTKKIPGSLRPISIAVADAALSNFPKPSVEPVVLYMGNFIACTEQELIALKRRSGLPKVVLTRGPQDL